jgi:hypothetical protein
MNILNDWWIAFSWTVKPWVWLYKISNDMKVRPSQMGCHVVQYVGVDVLEEPADSL